MARQLKLAAIVLALLWQSAAADDGPLLPHRAEYLLTRDGLPFADMIMELTLDPKDGYHYRADTRPHRAVELIMQLSADLAAGARVGEDSSGRLIDGRVRPDSYRYLREKDERQSITVTFDWSDGSADIVAANRPWSMAVPGGTQDKLSVLLALRADLAAGIQDLTYPVADGGKLKAYRYVRTGEQDIETPAGAWPAITLARSKDKRPVDYHLWLAPHLQYLPVQVERREGGALYRMELMRVTGLPDVAVDPP